MALKITKIRNLTAKKDLKADDLTKFNHQTEYSDTISTEVTIAENWNSNDNIQVEWSEGTELIRAVGGTFKKVGAIVTISGLDSVSKYSFDVNGQLSIGPEANPDAVVLSVRIGNRPSAQNPKADLIINFSDTEDGAPGTSIKLNQLVDWIKGKAGDTEVVEFPKKEGGDPASQPENFEIEFKKLYYNITQNTFDINVQSKADTQMTFGNFTIKKVGFRVTNTPVTLDSKTLEDGKAKSSLAVA
jgi:hypothetical protein